MSRTLTLSVALLAFIGAVAAQSGDAQAPGARENGAPHMVLQLVVDGKAHPIRLGEPLELQTPAPQTTVELRAEPYRVFPYGGVRFRYPREFVYAATRRPGLDKWTLEGSDCVFMIFRFPGRGDPDLLLRETLAAARGKFKDRAKAGPAADDLNGVKLEGTRLDITALTRKLTQTYYAVGVGPDTVVLVLQDSAPDDGEPGPGYARAMKMLRESFEVE